MDPALRKDCPVRSCWSNPTPPAHTLPSAHLSSIQIRGRAISLLCQSLQPAGASHPTHNIRSPPLAPPSTDPTSLLNLPTIFKDSQIFSAWTERSRPVGALSRLFEFVIHWKVTMCRHGCWMLWRKEEGEHTKEVNNKGAYSFFSVRVC